MFGNRLPLKQLSIVCRSLGTTLHAGVPIVKAVELAGGKASQPRLKSALNDVSVEIKSGSQLAPALAEHLDLVVVAVEPAALVVLGHGGEHVRGREREALADREHRRHTRDGATGSYAVGSATPASSKASRRSTHVPHRPQWRSPPM